MNVVTEDIVQLSKPTCNFPLVRLPTLLDLSVRPVHYPACKLISNRSHASIRRMILSPM